MREKKIIAPSILSADFSRLGEEVREVQAAGADWLHVDVMDGMYVPNISVGPLVVGALRRVTDLPLDVHLMIQDPDRYLDDFIRAGSDYIVVHAEATMHLQRTVSYIRQKGCKAGVSLNPATPLSHLDYVLADVDMVLIMSVNPGFGGQGFIPQMLDKISDLRAVLDSFDREILLEVDGGVKVDNIGEISRAGADVFVAGSAVFGSKNYAETLAAMRRNLGQAVP